VDEILGLTLVSLHNVHHFCQLMAQAREAIRRGEFRVFADRVVGRGTQVD
jgi:tRNA-guanine family transglycosylase